MLALLLAALTISDPVPVQVDPFKNTSHKKKLDAVGEDLTDAVRRALNASGHFVVVRSDLVDQVAKAQAKSLSAMFKDDGPSAGRFTRAKVLVRGAYKERSKNKLAIQVSFVDMGSLESLPKLDFAIVVPTEDADAMFTGVATRVAEKTSVAVGESPQRIDAEAKKQIALAARSAKDTVAMEKYREGRRLIAHHGIDAALKAKDAFEAALQIDPEYVPAMVELIRVEHFLANYARWIGEPWAVAYARLLHARDLAAKALELEPEFNTLHRELARVFLAMENLELYKEELAKAKVLMPSDPEVLLIEASGETSDDRKQALLEKVIALDPSNIEARYRHASILAFNGDTEGGGKELVFILKKLDPQHVFSKIDLAVGEYEHGRAQRAVLLLEQAKKTEPRIGLIDWNLAFAKDTLGKDGESFLGEGLARCSEALLRDLRSETELSDELFAKSLAIFAAAARERPDRVLVGFDYASMLVSSKTTKDIELGVELLRKLLERAEGKNTRLIIRYTLASALVRLDNHEDAQTIFADLASTLKTRAIRERMQLELADSLLATGKTARARAELSRLVKDAELADMRTVAANRLGASYRSEGNFDLALRYFQQALAVSEDYWTHYEIAQTFEEQRASDLRRLEKMTVQADREATQIEIDAASLSALAEYNASVKLYQGDAIVFAHLGALAWSLGQQDLAIGSYRRAAKLDSKYALDLAMTYARNGRLPDAEIELNAMIAEDPTNARLVALKGELYGALKLNDHAAAAFNDAFQLEPTWDYAKKAAYYFRLAKKFDQAMDILQVVMKKIPGMADGAWSQVGHVYHARKDDQGALVAHREARKLSPNNPGIEVNIGETLRRLGKLEEAERTLEAVLMGDATYERAYIELARVYKAQNSTPEAIKVLEKGATKLPTSRKIRLALVRLDRPHAVVRLAKLEQEDATFWRYPALRARFLAQDGKPGDAIVAYGRALELAPSNKRLYAAFAALLEKRGAINEAFTAYAMASYLDPGDARAAAAKTSLRAKGAKLVLLPVMPPEFIRDVIAVVRAAEAPREAKREAPKKQPKAVNVPSQT